MPCPLVVNNGSKPDQALRRVTLTEIRYPHKHRLPIDRFGSASDPAPFVRLVDGQDRIENDLLQLDPVALFTGGRS
jgi:hypothetical protein